MRSSGSAQFSHPDNILRELFETNPHPMWVYDTGTFAFLAVNDAAIRHYGFSRDEFLAMKLSSILAPELFPALEQRLPNLGGGVCQAGTWRHRTRSGDFINVETTTCVITYDGRPARLDTISDVTALQRTLAALQESESKYRLIVENANEGIVVAQDGMIKFANPLALSMGGYAWEEAAGRPFLDFVHPDDRAMVADNHVRRLRGELPSNMTYSFRIQGRDGSVRWVMMSGALTTWEGRTATVNFLNDVTENRKTLDALLASEEKYRDLFENANDAIFIVGPELYYLDANRKAVELLGYSKEELLQHRVTDFIPPEQVPRSQSEFEKLRLRGAYDNFVGKLQRADGRWLDVEVSSSAITDDGRIVGSRDIVRDITDRKRLEEDLFRMQKLEALGILAGGLAHDFNNLLTAIMGNLSLSLLGVAPMTAVHRQLQNAEKAAARARDLTQQLLTFSKGGEPIKRTVQLNDIVRDSVGFALRGSRAKAGLVMEARLWPVEADEGQISQVLSNLVINADQAMPDGGPLTVSCRNVTIGRDGATHLAPGRYVCITVTDRGMGIPPAHLEKIFDPYFTTKQKGSGLGLAMSYSIVRRHGGHISVESSLGQGTSFSVYLPASEKPAEQQAVRRGSVVAGAGKLLVMDDEEMVLDVAAGMLREAGYDVTLANDGNEAVEAFADAFRSGRPFDAVITDLTVPGGMGGEEAVRRMQEIDPGVRAIVSSGYSNNPVMSHYRDYGFRGVVIKPYTVEQLTAAVHDVLNEQGSASAPTAS